MNYNSNKALKTLHEKARYIINRSPFIYIFIADVIWEEI